MLPKALALAREVAETSPMSAMLNRHMLIRNSGLAPEEAHLVESKSIYWASRHADAREGIASFLDQISARKDCLSSECAAPEVQRGDGPQREQHRHVPGKAGSRLPAL